jgi:hypothetical protein
MPGPGVIPTVGSTQGQGVYFVNGDFGNDGYSGTSPQQCIKSLDVAYNKCAGGNNEIIYLIGGTAAVSYSSAIASGGAGLVWAKNYTHLIGLAAPTALGQRARITNGVSTVLLTPLMTVTGKGCLFQNFEIANVGSHATSAAVCLLAQGDRNAYINLQIAGGTAAATAANSAMRSLVIDGQSGGNNGEQLFKHCYIGTTTQQRGSTSAELELENQAARVTFEDCTFALTASVTTSLCVQIDANGILDHVVFENCKFINPSTFGGGSAIAQALSCNAAPGGVVMVHNSLSAGFTKFQTTASTAVIGDNPGSAAGGLGIAMTS